MRFGVDLPREVEDAFDFFTARLEHLGVMLTQKGVFAYFIGDQLIKKLGENFVKSLLRREYLTASHGPLKGAYLCRAVELYLIILKDAAKEKIQREPMCESVKKAAFSPEP